MQGKQRERPHIQRPIILDVLPPDIAPRLDKKHKSFNKKLIKHIPVSLRHRLALIAYAAIFVGAVAFIWQPWSRLSGYLPEGIATQITTFMPYYFEKAMPKGLSVDSKNLDYSDGVLFFVVKNQFNDTVVVSEQALPPEFASTRPQGDQTVTGVDGVASVSNRDGHTTGTFITKQNPKALISLNASGSVDVSTLKKIMQALKAIR